MAEKAKRRAVTFAKNPRGVTFRKSENAGLPMFGARCEIRRRNEGETLQGCSVFISQRLRSHGVEHTWDTIKIECGEEADATLSVKVIVSNPDWEEGLQIAHLRSRPGDSNSLIALGCNLDHRRVNS